MKFVDFAHLDKPIKKNGPHSGLETGVPGQDVVSGLPQVHASFFLTHEVPDLLLVGPTYVGKGSLAARVGRMGGRGLNEFAKPEDKGKLSTTIPK
jgi:hypothetical protein